MCKTSRLNSALCIHISEKNMLRFTCKGKAEVMCCTEKRFFLEVWPEFEIVDNFKRESFGSDKSGEVQFLPFDKIKYRDQRQHVMLGAYDDKQCKCNKYGNES